MEISRAGRRLFLASTLVYVAFLIAPREIKPIVVQLYAWWATIRVVVKTRHFSKAERRPWILLWIAGFGSLAGGIVKFIVASASGGSAPVPSPADLLFVVVYVSILGCELLLIRRRSGRGERGHLLDALLPGAAVGFAMWIFFLGPYVTNSTHPPVERAVNLGYAVISNLILCATLRLSVGQGKRPPAYNLLAGAMALFLASDFIVTLGTARGFDTSANQYLAIPIFGLLAEAATHPSAREIANRPIGGRTTLTRRRLVLLAGALLMSPVILLISLLNSARDNLAAVTVGSGAISLLVLARIVGLIRAEERSREREVALRSSGERLLEATDLDAIVDILLDGVTMLVDGERCRTTVVLRSGNELVSARSIGRASGLVSRDASGIPEALGVTGFTTWHDRPAVDISPTEDHDNEPMSYLLPLGTGDHRDGLVIVSCQEGLDLGTTDALEAITREAGLAMRALQAARLEIEQKSERRFKALIESANDIVAVADATGVFTFMSPVAERLLGYPDGYLLGRPPIDLVHAVDQHRMESLDTLVGRTIELRLRHATGVFHWFEIHVRDLRDDAVIEGWVINARHIGDRKRAELLLQRSETRFRALVQRSSDVVAVVSTDGVIEYVSPAVERIVGLTSERVTGANLMELFRSERLAHYLARSQRSDETLDTVVIEAEAIRSEGTRIVELTVSDLRGEAGIEGIVLNGRDVTDRRGLEQSLRHQALHDDLTGLPNRALLMENLVNALATEPGKPVALLFLDLDDFKDVNDSLGHEAGDQLLVAVAERLTSTVRIGDTAARIGGDEFAILIPEALGDASVLDACERIIAAVAQPILVGGRQVSCAVSLGVAFDYDRTTTPEVLLRNADVAMYRAKERGKGRVETFEEHLHASAFHRFEMRTDLKRAIVDDEFLVYYQPILDLATTQIVGAEALVRWMHPVKGLLGPVDFIPVAEATGLIVPLGRWVMAEATRQIGEWNRQLDTSLKISVNVSIRQLEDVDLLAEITQALDVAKIGPEHLCVEITESIFAADQTRAIQRLTGLRNAGIRIAIDDFGTGYSSLTQVQDYPFDVLKIDKSFVDRLGGEQPQDGVVRTIMRLADDLGVTTVAEGIEHATQLRELVDLGCEQGQGYYFSRPVTADAFAELLDNQSARSTV